MAVALITTGGTIGWHGGQERMLPGMQLCEEAGIRVDRVVDAAGVPSWDLSVDDMVAIASAVCREIDTGATGVVVAHGTDTLEETAWLTDLLLGDRRAKGSVVFTGAMRFWDHPETDGPTNLREAVAAVGTTNTGHGVQAVFAGRTHAARWVRKVDAAELDAFDSGGRPSSAPTPPVTARAALDTRVAIVKVGALAMGPLPEHFSGLVLEGTGAAHVPTRYHQQIRDIAGSGVPVVLASRCRDLPRRSGGEGLILNAADLAPEKAALALMVALGEGLGPDALHDWWERLIQAGQDATASP